MPSPRWNSAEKCWTLGVKKAVAAAVSFSLFLSTPGIPFYQAFAGGFTNAAPKTGVGRRSGTPVGTGLQSIGDNVASGNFNLGLPTSQLPVLSDVGVFSSPQAPIADAPKHFRGRASRAIVERASKTKTPQKGLWGAIVHRVRGDDSQSAPAAAQFIAPKQESLATAGSSRKWGAKSFDVLRGAKTGQAADLAVAVAALTPAHRRSLLAPSSRMMMNAADPISKLMPRAAAPSMNFPSKAVSMDTEKLLAGKYAAQVRARAKASDARLVRVAFNLDDPRGNWSYIFHSRQRSKLIIVYPSQVWVREDSANLRKVGTGSKTGLNTAQTLWNTRLARTRSFESAFAAMQQKDQGFQPVRVEIVSKWKKNPVYAFINAAGGVLEVPGVESADKQKVKTPPLAKAKTVEPVEPVNPADPVEPEKPLPAPPKEDGEARAPPQEAPAGKTARSSQGGPHLHEDLLGFRKVRGRVHGEKFGRLPANATVDQIIQQIAAQFNMSSTQVLALGYKHRITAESGRASWLAIYDRLQKANRDEFKQLDQQKYHGGVLSEAIGHFFHRIGLKKNAPKTPNYRELANKTYSPGLKGMLQRTAEMHKHVVGVLFRLPYHLFDMFFFGYFRKNISYEFFHSTEDFITLRDELELKKARDEGTLTPEMQASAPRAERILEAAMKTVSARGVTKKETLRANSTIRALDRWFWTPLVSPLGNFLYRRATLAVFSAIAMGLIGGLLPLPLMAFHLTSIPFLGEGIMMVGHGLPTVAANVPFVGETLASITGAAMNPLLEGLTVGALLNTLMLSTLLTFPAAVKHRMMELRGDNLHTPPVFSIDFMKGMVVTFFTWTFWSRNLKSFSGLMLVGAEIEGIMTYMGEVDGAISPTFEAATGHEFKLFHTIGAAIERPEGDSPIPFGGAITWGNSLIYQAQSYLGFNVSDAIARPLREIFYQGEGPDAVRDALRASSQNTAKDSGMSVTAMVAGSVMHGALREEQLVKTGTPEEMAARGEEAKRSVGDIERDIASVKERIRVLDQQISGGEQTLQELEQESKPITDEERRQYEETLRQLTGKRDEGYVRSKLAEIRDIEDADEATTRVKMLADLQAYYTSLLPKETITPGYHDSIGVKLAIFQMVQTALQDFEAGPKARLAPKRTSVMDQERARRIAPMVTDLEQLRAQAKSELASRDAIERLLRAVERTRNLALGERRSGKEMLEFHKNLSRLATVMDLAFSLNTIEAAQKAIKDMETMLDNKLDKIERQRGQSAADLAWTREQEARRAEWEAENAERVKDHQTSKSDMQRLENQTRKAVDRIQGFRAGITDLIARINAEDSSGSPDALAEYERRLALLPQLQKEVIEGIPGDEDFISIKSLNDQLEELEELAVTMADGLVQIDGTPLEFAGVLVFAVPGVPEFNVTNPSLADAQVMLEERRAHWQEQLAEQQESLKDLQDQLDPSNSATELDEFGDSNPVSLPKRLEENKAVVARASADVETLARQIDAAAAKIRAVVPGADLPSLSGSGLEQLQDDIAAYGDKLQAVNLPSDDSDATFDARMALFDLASLLPQAGFEVITWSKADATVETIEEALVSPIPQLLDLFQKQIDASQAILDDVDQDVAYINGARGLPENQDLIDRKRALLGALKPTINDAIEVVNDTLLPFYDETAASFDPEGDRWAKLFNSQITLFEGARDVFELTVPWSLTSNGAAEGDTGAALANIADARQDFRDLLDGFTDEEGKHTGIIENLADIEELLDPNNMEMDEVWGQLIPVSLPRLVRQFTAERAQRAGQINAQHQEINDILVEIDRLTDNRFNLTARAMTTSIVAGGAGSEAEVRRLVDDNVYKDLGELLTDIGTEYQERGEGLTDSSTSEGVPSGFQPSPDVDNDTRVALFALEAAKRLVPSTSQNPEEAAAAFAVARYLYSDGVIETANLNINERIPFAQTFLNQAKDVLESGIRDLDQDQVYVNSNQTAETPDEVFDRKIAIFSALNAVTRMGGEFYTARIDWANDSFESIVNMESFYSATGDVHDNSLTVAEKEIDAINTMRDSLRETFVELEDQRKELVRWINQLNNPEESALKRVGNDLRRIQEKTRRVLEENVKFRELDDRFDRSENALEHTLGKIDDLQGRLARELKDLDDPRALSPELRQRVDALRISGSSWYMPGDTGDATSALVIPKKDFVNFVDTLFGSLLNRTSSARDLAGLRESLLNNPASLASVIPGSQVVNFGDADGFYLVYQTQFSVPNGLETSSWVTLGNVAQVWGNNISVSGYVFASPPNELNAPWGDKGVKVSVESLQGKNWVNYLDVDFHRFIQNIPPDTRMASTARESRIMLFEDFAMLLFGGRVYVAATGFADAAVHDPKENPIFYGGSVKTSLKFTEVVFLDAEHQVIKADDPRFFEQVFNLNFTGLDEDLNQDFRIRSDAQNKRYSRTQVGPRIDVSKIINSDDAFEVDLFWARQRGTDDFNQDSYGVNILKGFTIRDKEGKPWVVISNKAGYEAGEKFNTLSDRVSVQLPNWGVVVSAEGRLIGDARTYYLEAAKKTGANTSASIGYGSRYVGQEPRLTISMNTSFTLGELWRAVADRTGEELKGSVALEPYSSAMDEFYKGAEDDTRVQELKSVFMRDVGSKIVQQDIGRLVKEIQDLRSAGAFADNTRVRATVGFVTNPVGESLADRAIGGGFMAGTQTSLELNDTQKALIESKMQTVYRESLRLQFRMLELTKQWQETVTEIAQAQWDIKMAVRMKDRAPTETLRSEGAAKLREAELRLKQGTIRYNMLSGRDPGDALPFENLNAGDLAALLGEIRALIQTPEALETVLQNLDPKVIRAAMGDNPFNLMKWVPWIEQLTFSFGAQLSDYLANQVLGIGITLRLPVYDPASKETDKAFILESKATALEILQIYEDFRLQSEKRLLEAKAWTAGAETLRVQALDSSRRLSDAIKGYRNGLVPERRLRDAFSQWHWYMQSLLEAEAKASLTAGWSRLDASFGRETRPSGPPPALNSFQEVFDAVADSAYNLQEIAMRRQAAAHMTEANNQRIQKFYVDLMIGYNLTADGVGWLPSIGVTGIPITPVLTFELKPAELRELQLKQGEGQTKYYERFKAKLEADLAVEVFKGIASFAHARDAAQLLENEVIQELRATLKDVQRRAAPGDPTGTIARAQKDLDTAERKLQLTRLMRDQALAALNHLLGRDPSAPLDPNMSPAAALQDLKSILAEKAPTRIDRDVLLARVEVARAVETMVDKNLKLEELRLEPVSLVVRSLSRLMGALSNDTIGNPDLVAAARVQTLHAERALESFDRELPVRRAQIDAQLAAVDSALKGLQGKTDPHSRLKIVELTGQKLMFEASLARLDGVPLRSQSPSSMPTTYNELFQRLASAEQRLAAAGKNPEVRVFKPETHTNRSEMNVRYFKANTDLAGDPIDDSFVESWITFRLKNMSTPPEVLLALSRLREAKADRVHRNEQAAARSRAQILLSQFETNVRLARWSGEIKLSQSSLTEDQRRFEIEIRTRLEMQAGRMKALLNLPVETTVEQLMRLVPADPGGDSGNLEAIAKRFVDDVNRLQIEQLRRTLFEGGIPASFGNEDGLMEQIRADVIAERMSYKGFTPTIAFGFFRGKHVNGIFLEAPDPRSIEHSLQNVLSDSVRKELQSAGRMHDLTLRLHLLMSSVSGRAKLVEAQSLQVRSAERDYRVAASRYQAGHPEITSAQDAMVRSRLELTDTVATLKNDFIELVAELEAVGFDPGQLLKIPANDLDLPSLDTTLSPIDRIVDYASRASLRSEFIARFNAHDFGTPEQRILLTELADEYRLMEHEADLVRYHPGFSARERLELLTKADVEGRRQAVERVIRVILTDAYAKPSERAKVFSFLLRDVEEHSKRMEGVQESEWKLLSAMRRTIIDDLPFGARGAFERIETLRLKMDVARQALLEDYLTYRRGPTEFVMRDVTLDAYLSQLQAYDEEVIKVFSHAEIKNNDKAALLLNSIFSVRESLTRQKAFASHGRGMLALDALIEMQNARLAASRWDKASPEKVREIHVALTQLMDLRAQWYAKNPVGLVPLYAITTIDAEGRRLWKVDEWLTGGDLQALIESDRVTVERTGDSVKFWLQPGAGETGKREIVGGVDAALWERDFLTEARDDNKARVRLHDVFKTHEFAAVSLNGRTVEGISHQDAMQLAAAGKAFSFRNSEDGYGLHPAQHPLQALWDDPSGTVMVLYRGDKEYSRDRFPTFESLRDHIRSLVERGEEEEASKFVRLEAGPDGVGKMISFAKEYQARTRTMGWTSVKLQTYGFAVGPDGTPAETLLTKQEFKEFHESLLEAQETYAQSRVDAIRAKALERAASVRREQSKATLDEETVRFNTIRAQITLRLKDGVAAENPRRNDEEEKAYEHRLSGLIDEAVVDDRYYKKAQVRHAGFLEAFNEVDADHRERDRGADKALRIYKNAALIAAKAGHGERYAEDYLETLEHLGVNAADLEIAKGLYEGTGARRLFFAHATALHVDAANQLVRVTGDPVFGKGELDREIREPNGDVQILKGELFGAVLDRDATYVKLYFDPKAMDAAAQSWTIRDVHENGAGKVVYTAGGKEIDPNFRLKHYTQRFTVEEGESVDIPVMLNRRYFISRVANAGRDLAQNESWSYGPWNWGNILMEIPRGITGTPVELLMGRDANQHNYLGRVHMKKIEGGATKHHNFFREALGVLDVLDLMPDPVDWYFDPSQFPDRVTLDSELRPGENIYDHDARSGKKEIHFGRTSIERTIVYNTEDLLNANNRVKSYFRGGLQDSMIEKRSGRAFDAETGVAKRYYTSTVKESVGIEALEEALQDRAIAFDQGSYLNDGEVRLAELPRHLAVDLVERRVKLRVGSDQYQDMARELGRLPELLEAQRDAAQARADGLTEAAAVAERRLAELLADLERSRGEQAELWDQAHRMIWRIGKQEAIEREIAKIKADLRRWKAEREVLRQRLLELEEELRREREREDNPTDPTNPDPVPNPEDPVDRSPWWPWIIIGMGIWALIAGFWEWLRRRRGGSVPGLTA